MASGFFALMDDIAALMDDVAAASKIATKKTAGILGDDLAVNAEKATGFLASRELPVLWKITKGSFLNKVIIIPIVFLLMAYVPIAIKILLIAGGCYLAYEGVEKIIEWIFHKKDHGPAVEKLSENKDMMVAEKEKVKSAIITDFILSAEIIIIALGEVLNRPMNVQIMTVSVVAILATVGVYGVVALIVRMDDTGYKILRHSKGEGFKASIGRFLVRALPVVIRILSVVGTIALIFVSGGLFAHNIAWAHDFLPAAPGIVREAALGLIGGILVVIVIALFKKIYNLVVK